MPDIKINKPFRKTARVTIDTGPGLTEQCHKEECDMNYILRDYQKTGLIKHAKENEGRYDDISVQDFQEAMLIVKEAENMFSGLPSNIRKRFQNNPAEFLEFTQNAENRDEMVKLGILRGNDGLNKDGEPVPTPKPDKPVQDTTEPQNTGS